MLRRLLDRNLLVIGVFLLVIVLVGWQLLLRQTRQQVEQTVEVLTEEVATRNVSTQVLGEGDGVGFELINGWNLVAFPVVPEGFSTAAELVADVAAQGGYITTVAYWDRDQWREISYRADQMYGNDFDLEANRAYFLRSQETMFWAVPGERLAIEDFALDLEEGWNAVGFLTQGEQNAEEVLDAINQGEERATEINRWWYGVWDPFVKRLYSEENVETYGEAYEIEDNRGYFIYLNEPATFSLVGSE